MSFEAGQLHLHVSLVRSHSPEQLCIRRLPCIIHLMKEAHSPAVNEGGPVCIDVRQGTDPCSHLSHEIQVKTYLQQPIKNSTGVGKA